MASRKLSPWQQLEVMRQLELASDLLRHDPPHPEEAWGVLEGLLLMLKKTMPSDTPGSMPKRREEV